MRGTGGKSSETHAGSKDIAVNCNAGGGENQERKQAPDNSKSSTEGITGTALKELQSDAKVPCQMKEFASVSKHVAELRRTQGKMWLSTV